MRGEGMGVKTYDALVEGDASDLDEIELPLESRGRRVVALFDDGPQPSKKGRPARTAIRPVRRLGEFTLLEVTIGAGFRHQIRAHLAAVGHPIANDELYGAVLVSGLERPFLHARRVALKSPSTGEALAIEAPLAKDLEEELRRLEEVGAEPEQG